MHQIDRVSLLLVKPASDDETRQTKTGEEIVDTMTKVTRRIGSFSSLSSEYGPTFSKTERIRSRDSRNHPSQWRNVLRNSTLTDVENSILCGVTEDACQALIELGENTTQSHHLAMKRHADVLALLIVRCGLRSEQEAQSAILRSVLKRLSVAGEKVIALESVQPTEQARIHGAMVALRELKKVVLTTGLVSHFEETASNGAYQA